MGENTGLDVDGEGRQLLLENVKFADGADYSKGFGSIKIELGSERGGEGIGIADMKILERGKIILSDIYSDNMILPKNKPFAVRGYGLSGGAEITAQILDDADHVVAETSDVTNETGSFACSFSSLSGLDSAESYKMLLKSGTLEKTINNIAVGDIWVFGGSEKISAVSGSGNGNRLFLTDETGKGQWKYAEDCAELGAQAEILGRLKERNGNNAGGIVGLKNAEAFLPEGVIYLASVNDLKNGIGQLGEYVETARENNIRIIYTVPCGGEGLSAEELFSLRCEAAALEKANYGVVKSVPTVRADSASDIIERIVNGIYDEYVSLTDYELSVLGNKAYLFLSDNIEEAYGDDFLAETTSGRVCGAEKAEKSGSVIELTFNTDEDIIKLYYGKNGITLPIYSDDRRTVLMPFVCDYDGKEEFDFAKEYDRARFEKLYCAASGMFSGSGLTVSEGDMLVRDKLGYPIDDVKISMSLAGSGRIQLFINEEKLFEGELLNDNTISIQKNDAGLKINGRTVESSIERIDKLTVKFTDVSDLLLTGFKIDMPQYSDVLAVVIGLNGLPDSDTAAYDDVEDIAELCDKYDELGGETNSFFSSEVHEKVERLKSFCKKIDAEKKSIREKVEAAFSVTEENHRVTIGLSNSSSLVPFDVECLAVVYDSEGMLVSISSERKTVAPNGTERVELSPSLTGAENGYINYYVINDAASGYIIGADVKNEL